MNVSDQIIQVLDNLCEKFGLMIDWTSENVVPYVTTLCTKLVSYEIWTSVAWMAILCIFGIAVAVVMKKYIPIFKAGVNQDDILKAVDWEIGSVFVIIGLVVFYIVVCVAFVSQIMDIIKCMTFPEMFIFEYIQGLINTAS